MSRPNVLLIILDSVRAENTSLHGYARETTPFLESFARSATHYREARAPGEQSITSHASIFTGMGVREHGLTDRTSRLAPGHTIWETLAGAGYATASFSANPFLSHLDVGLSHGFETVVTGERTVLPFPDAVDPREYAGGFDGGSPQYRDFLADCLSSHQPFRSFLNALVLRGRARFGSTGLDSILFDPIDDRIFTDRFAEWHSDQTGPWAACLNLMDAHSCYAPRSEHNRWADTQTKIDHTTSDYSPWDYPAGERPWSEKARLQDLYDGTIHQVDAAVARLISTLDRRDDLDDTLVVITADHGEGFGEQSEYRKVRSSGHGSAGGLEEPLLHVPLLVQYPDQTDASCLEEPATLTRFPDVVEGTVRGDRPTFVPNGPVIASSPGMNELAIERTSDFFEDLTEHTPSGDALYRRQHGRLEKFIKWNSTVTKVRLPERRPVEPTAEEIQWVTANIPGSDTTITNHDHSADQVADTTLARLHALGYA